MSTLQEQVPAPLDVICDFYFEQAGPAGSAIYDGDKYPYPPLPSDKGSDYRYAWGTTPILLAATFHAQAFTVEGKVQPHVIPPPGVTILQYFWDFGDGFTGFGPTVTHTYEVPDPSTSISLTVVDSLGREFSTSKPLSLVVVDFGVRLGYTIRGVNTETPPKRKFAEANEKALADDGPATFYWRARGGKPVREEEEAALSEDRATITTHWMRRSTDTSATSDAATFTRLLPRHATETALATDVATQRMHRFAGASETALTVDRATGVRVAVARFLGRLVPKVIHQLSGGIGPGDDMDPKML